MVDESAPKSTDIIFSAIHALDILTYTSDFKSWLWDYYKIEDDTYICQGYKFAIMTIFRSLLDAISRDYTLALDDDYIFFRANFEGMDLKDIPNTCDKIVFIKNLNKGYEKLVQSKNWSEVEKNLIEIKEIISIFDSIYRNNVSGSKKCRKDAALNYLTKYFTMMYLNKIEHDFPWGAHLPSFLYPKLELTYFDDAYFGYAYSIQYIWFKLLGKKFNNYCVRDLHIAHERYPSSTEVTDEYDIDDEGDELPNRDEWHSFARYCYQIDNELIRPLEKKMNINIGTDTLLVIKGIEKTVFNKYLNKNRLLNPDYLDKNDNESKIKKLEYYLLWHRVDLIGGQDNFNGVQSFIHALVGAITLTDMSKYHDVKEKAYIRVFKHPVGYKEDAFDYSYAILINPILDTGSIGWLIFEGCTTDYSGYGTLLKNVADIFIEKYNNVINFKEMEIDEDLFKYHLLKKCMHENYSAREKMSFDIHEFEEFQYELESQQNEYLKNVNAQISQYMDKIKGKMFEYVFSNLISKEFNKVHCDVKESNQIDCVGYSKKKITVFDCKYTIHSSDLEHDIAQIKKKSEYLKNKNKGYTIIPCIAVYTSVSDITAKVLRMNDIKLRQNVRDEIRSSNALHQNSKDSIIKILDYNLS